MQIFQFKIPVDNFDSTMVHVPKLVRRTVNDFSVMMLEYTKYKVMFKSDHIMLTLNYHSFSQIYFTSEALLKVVFHQKTW